ncbi:xanthine dehydrogenase family protein molybdopterin-binding subunit [Streptomyces tubercidicus]|uniref:xanthine dehydrogenase family protein molybdopterin-binding subunit n=1 Tax=Streptomyces tubercidicus TaxID=47759 RepID=UPI002E10CE1D|nr:xanthine dehydrogenase family protein molybdopterin-binding subunit [Streptomyces tubercidicus]WSK39387.1 xanthine dehydrogenase family protein molybdopterin-binding subunit [Streptomyces tubercidicus]WSX18360.1 xanthine dehydrogenase family protein molybdopterin-binding subunit [Streptomyces tubercidicus]WSX24963.1 xanthine dehydrogenase family protein molybdopterin-binding subunit [Streptomyces tubercidicus]
MTEEHRHIGKPVPPPHHDRLARGHGRFLADLPTDRTLHAAFVRSPLAHAEVVGFDATTAGNDPRCALVLGPDNLAERTAPIPTAWRLPGQPEDRIPVAAHTARYAGQPLGIVVADTPTAAEDLAEAVRLDLAPLPPVPTVAEALAEHAPLIVPGTTSNEAGQIRFGAPQEDLTSAFSRAAVVVAREFTLPRVNHAPLEPRGVLAAYDPGTGLLTVHASSQSPHSMRQDLCAVLGLRADRVRVIAPDVGGSFGSKVLLYPDEAMVCAAAVALGTAVRWVESRAENFTSAYQGRGQHTTARLAVSAEGRFLGLDAQILADLGGYATQAGSGPHQVAALTLQGPYHVDAAAATVTGVYTTRIPTGAYRGYGMQEAAFIRERLIDEAARELGLSPAELRLRNLIRPEELPHTTHTGLTYDSGDYGAALRRATELAERPRPADPPWVRRATAAVAAVEISAFAPSALLEAFGIAWSGWEGVRLRINHDGTVTAYAGVTAVGQGIETSLAQIAAEGLGVPLDWVRVELGDTDTAPHSDLSAQASRALTLAGGALVIAARRLADRMRTLAADFLGTEPERVTQQIAATAGPASLDAAFHRPDGARITWREVAHRGYRGWGRGQSTTDQIRLDESVDFDPPQITFAYGAHTAEVTVDLGTGRITVTGYWAVHDSGVLVNPLIAHGQIVGGITQGLGQALTEEATVDPEGVPTTRSFGEYTIPAAQDVPDNLVVEHTCTPSTAIPGGFKGLGEGGTILPPAAVACAVAAAVPEIAHTLTSLPLTPPRVRAALRAAGITAEGGTR